MKNWQIFFIQMTPQVIILGISWFITPSIWHGHAFRRMMLILALVFLGRYIGSLLGKGYP